MGEPDYRQRIAERLRTAFLGMERATLKRESEEAKANPQAHKLTRVFEQRTSYRYWRAGKDGRGREVRFCWSSHRNVAGYFLGWREVWSKKQREGKRDQYLARKVRKRVEEVAKRRADAFKAKHSKAPEVTP